ncbi:MAG: cytochrome b5 domain-containing protein [Gammaproteobacteria bacterium]
MRVLFVVSTVLFWLAVGGLWAAARDDRGHPPAESAPANTYTLADVALHATAQDCWMALDGAVHDFTAYLPSHPAEPGLMLSWCGKEASEAFRTKTRGRAHSPYAASLLPKYRIGVLSTQ